MRDNGPVTQRNVPMQDGQFLVSRTDPRGVITFSNDAFVAISGYSREELIGQSHNLVRHPDMPAVAFADLWSTLKSGRCWVGVVKNRCKNGDHYWVRAAVSPVIEGSSIAGYISVRTKPSADLITASDRAYARIRGGDGSLTVRRGQAVHSGLLGSLIRGMGSLQVRQIAVLLGLVGIIGGIALSGLYGGSHEHVLVLGLSTAGALLALIAAITLPLVLSRRLSGLKGSLDRLSRGDITEPIDLSHQDEFNETALAVANLQSTIGYAKLSSAEIRTRTLGEFDRSVGGVIGSMSVSIKDMKSTAQSQSAVSGQVTTNAQTVAASASELNASIKEISSQAAQVSELARQAAQTAEGSRATMASLAKAAQEITAVAQLIAGIAEQTNLLALNATIEAARAGDVGRGFAVVAGEVKSLANQTHTATGDINRKIDAVQRDSQAAVAALESVATSIGKLNDASHAIAAAVEEQSAVVDEVARNAEQAAAAAKETGAAAQAVTKSSESLAEGEAALNKAVTSFKAGIGASG